MGVGQISQIFYLGKKINLNFFLFVCFLQLTRISEYFSICHVPFCCNGSMYSSWLTSLVLFDMANMGCCFGAASSTQQK